jgi:hypothetical protein
LYIVPDAFIFSACFFLGTYDAGSTHPGDPYRAKWPDEFGNLKQRDIVRPDCVGKYFSKSNIIDVGNQLRQNELQLERLWRTKNPWFRIDCTLVGICVVDALLAARYAASSGSGIRKMTVQDWAMHIACDLWTRKISNEPRSEIAIARANVASSPVVVRGDVGRPGPLTFEQVRELHRVRQTEQKTRDLVRRACIYCKTLCSRECTHPVCMAKVKKSTNRWGDKVGTFICGDGACEDKHCKEIMGLSA